MNGLFDHSLRQDNNLSLKRIRSHQLSLDHHHHHQEVFTNGLFMPHIIRRSSSNNNGSPSNNNNNHYYYNLRREDDILDPPAVTVVLEGRSICQRISLHKHSSYQSLAKALRQMFSVDYDDDDDDDDDDDLDLSNAVPGHLIAYEDMDNDLLLAGDLNWKDFVRVAKRIRILPAKSNSKKPESEVV